MERNLQQLVSAMTLDEKIAQLMQLSGEFYYAVESKITGPMEDMGITDEVVKYSGSVLGASGAEETIRIQSEYLKNNRHQIPLLFMADIIHGYKTIFPIPLALGCSWDMDLAEKTAAVAAKEAAVSGVHLTFAPMVDLVRDPRWGRVMESTGEDSFLNADFAKAFVRGFQGKDLKNDFSKVAGCVKHFAAYGAPEGGRDYNTVNMSERQLRETYLPAYKAALDEGCEMVMTAFNTVDGIPASHNSWLMRDLLRDEWNFDGVLISDWGAVKEAIPHGVATNEKEAAKLSIEAGVDIEMMTPCYVNHLKELVEAKEVEEALIDEAVLRILKLKDKLGLFENPFRGADLDEEAKFILCEEHRTVAREAAEKSAVLLKNSGILPLSQQQKIALLGPLAESKDIMGAWSWKGNEADVVSLAEGMKAKAADLTVQKGCGLETVNVGELTSSLEGCQDSDVIVLALGEPADWSGEAKSRADIKLPQAQLELVKKAKETGKPVVAVLFNGRPLDLHGVLDEADAVLEAWYPGTEGGNAIANLLFGEAIPSGKLSMSFPYSLGQVPIYYNHYNTGRPKVAEGLEYVSQYIDIPNEPLLPFGFGLSYTQFSYENLKLSAKEIADSETLEISIDIKNTGKALGIETVQLYIRDKVGKVVRPMKELKGYEKIQLNAGEKKTVVFEIKEDMLRYWNQKMEFTSDAGEFDVFVGGNSSDVLQASFFLKK